MKINKDLINSINIIKNGDLVVKLLQSYGKRK